MFFQLESIFTNIVAEINGGLRGKNNLQKQQNIYIYTQKVSCRIVLKFFQLDLVKLMIHFIVNLKFLSTAFCTIDLKSQCQSNYSY